jgi:hypothetical protein
VRTVYGVQSLPIGTPVMVESSSRSNRITPIL